MSPSPAGPIEVGILGGGQLAQMLASAAIRLGLKVAVHSESADCPAASTGARIDTGPLRGFFARVRVVVFENEFVDCRMLARESEGTGARFEPGLPVIEELQDKLRQKRLLERLGIPTSPFAEIDGARPDESVAEAFARFRSDGAVFKWSRMGYDGKGVLLARDGAEGLAEARAFCREALARGIPVYAERKVRFARELAIVAARAADGGFAAYPLVVSEQERGICRRVTGPATALGASPRQEGLARDFARRVAEGTGLTGCLALELFEGRNEELLVNEIAPRVHNSGHYTMDAARTSQFENHWRAVLGLGLGSTECSPAFAMLNLLGPEGVAREASEELLPRASAPLVLHWYDKREIRPRRKLGHLNAVAISAGELAPVLSRMEDCNREWSGRLRAPGPDSTSSRKTP
jgi:5-(carboxyamino)imidazole ribonucleotide synthase